MEGREEKEGNRIARGGEGMEEKQNELCNQINTRSTRNLGTEKSRRGRNNLEIKKRGKRKERMEGWSDYRDEEDKL